MAITRLYFRNTQLNPGTGGTVYDLNETQGSPAANIYLDVPNNAPYGEVAAFTIPVDDTVTGTSFDTSVVVSTISSGKGVRWRVQRRNSSGVVQASSAYATEVLTTGTHTATLTLTTTWATGDRLVVSVEGGHVSGHGGGGVDIATQNASAYVDADITAATVYTGQAALDGSGDIAGTGTARIVGAVAFAGEGLLGATAGATVAYGAAAVDGSGDLGVGGGGTSYVNLTNTAPDWVSSPYDAARDVVDDFELRLHFRLPSYTPTGRHYLASTRSTTAGWGLNLETSGAPRLYARIDGVDNFRTCSASLATVATAGEWVWLKLTRVGTLVQYHTSLNGTSWTQLGTDTSALTGSITPFTEFGLAINAYNGSGALASSGGQSADYSRVQLWKGGIEGVGTLVNDFDASLATAGQPTSVTASTGEVWTFNGTGYEVFVSAGNPLVTAFGEADLDGSGDISGTSGGDGAVTGEAALSGEGDAAASGLTRALGAVAMAGSGLVAAAGLAIALTAAALLGAGDLAGTGASRALGQGVLDGAGTLVGSGLATALGASAPSGDGVISAAGTTVSFGTVDFAGEGDLYGASSAGPVQGAVAFGGSGDVAGGAITTAFGVIVCNQATVMYGTEEVTFGGQPVTFGDDGCRYIYGVGDLAATSVVVEGAYVSMVGEGVIAGAGTTESFAAADVDGSGDLAGDSATGAYGASDLTGEGVLAADGNSIAVGASALDGSGDIAGDAFTESFAVAALDGSGDLSANAEAVNLGAASLTGEGTFATDGEAAALAAGNLLGEGTLVGSGITESFGAVSLAGEGDLYGASSAGPAQGAVALGGSGDVSGGAVTTAFGVVTCNSDTSVAAGADNVVAGLDDVIASVCKYVYGEGDLAGSATVVLFGGAALSGEGNVVGAGVTEALAAADLTGEGDLVGGAAAAVIQGTVAFDGGSSLSGGAVTTAFGVIVCNESVVTWNGEEVTFGGVPVLWGDAGCRYIYGVGDLAATSVVVEGAYGSMVGEGNLAASGTTTAFGVTALTGEGDIVAGTAAATPCYISLESNDNVLLEDGYKLESEVPSCSTGTAALSGSGEIAGLGYLVFYGTVAFDGSGLIDATSLDIAQGTSAINGSGDIAADGETLSIAAASLSGEGHLYAASQGHGIGVAALTGEGIISGDLIQQATRCTISLETGFTVRLEDASRLLAEPDSCAKAAVTGEGLLDGAGGAVAYAEAACTGEGRFGAYGEDSSWGSAAFTGEGRFGAYGGDNHLGLINFTGEGILNRCNAILAEDGDGILFEDAGRIVTVCLARPITVYFVSADLVGEGILDAYAKDTGVLYYFLKRNLVLEGRLYYLSGGDKLLAENSELILGMTLEGSNWVFGELEEI